MSEYLHGIETQSSNEINMTVTSADVSSVVVIGTSPIAIEGTPKITNFVEAKAIVGENLDDFTLAEAVETILKESDGATIFPINIFDAASHTTAVTNEELTFTSGSAELAHHLFSDLVIKKGSTTLVENTDYTVEGDVITVVAGGAISSDQTNVKASYKYADKTKITDAHVVGTTNQNGTRTGAQKIYDIIAQWGITPGIIIAPGFSSKIVRTGIETIGNDIRALCIFDAPQGTTIAQAETTRLNASGGTDLTGNNENSMLAMPYVYRYNSNQNTKTLKPLSPVLAGIRVRLDRERNIAKSISNTVSKTILGTEYPIYFALNKANTDSNRLNSKGITTIINRNGEFIVWGGRNMSFPSSSGLMTFECAKRVRNFINKSIEDSSFVCVDENITRGFIDDVLNALNDAFAKWSNPLDTKNHIIYDGYAYYDEAKNPAEEIANGHVKFSYKHCPLASAERITFEDVLDITIIEKSLNS